MPIHIGIPGAMELPKLMAVAARIGVTDSARYLMKQRSLLRQLLRPGSFGADAFLRDLAPAVARPGSDVRALHLFTMNQVEQTVAWQQRVMESVDE